MTTANKRTAIVPKGLKYQKKTQVRSSSGHWVPRYGMAAGASRETAYRHVWSRRGDRRLGVFQFRIIRDDGEVADETMFRDPESGNYNYGRIIICLKDESEESGYKVVGDAYSYVNGDLYMEDSWTFENGIWSLDWYETKCSYNTETQIWSVPFFDKAKQKKGKKFWIAFYNITSDITSWYVVPTTYPLEYAYLDADRFQDKDLIRPKFYEVAVPYFEVFNTENNHVAYVPPPVRFDGTHNSVINWACPDPMDCPVHKESICEYFISYPTNDYYFSGISTVNKSLTITRKIKSSVAYNLFIDADKAAVSFYGECTSYCCHVTCAQCSDGKFERWFCEDAGEDVSAITSEEDSSSNLTDNPIDVFHKIVPSPYTMKETEHSITLNYNGFCPYEYIQNCYQSGPECEDMSGEVIFELDYMFFKANGSIRAYKTTVL